MYSLQNWRIDYVSFISALPVSVTIPDDRTLGAIVRSLERTALRKETVEGQSCGVLMGLINRAATKIGALQRKLPAAAHMPTGAADARGIRMRLYT